VVVVGASVGACVVVVVVVVGSSVVGSTVVVVGSVVVVVVGSVGGPEVLVAPTSQPGTLYAQSHPDVTGLKARPGGQLFKNG